jgi:Ca-activated chloride channel family protein
MRLLNPAMGLWLLAVPVAALFWWRHFAYKRRAQIAILGGEHLSRRSRPRRDLAVLCLATFTLLLLAAAMTRPQLRREVRLPVFAKRDLVLLLDRSISMAARDVRPSRFGRAIAEIRNFLAHKPDGIDRVALVAFAGTSVVLSYPTDDVASLDFYLQWLRDDHSALFGTDIAGALTSAMTVIRRDPQAVPPVIVVVSDGDDDTARVEAAAAAVTRAGIRVHAIGIGSDRSVPMPVATTGGREEFLRDDDGQLLLTKFDERTLQHLATLTGGLYFRSTSGGELAVALDRIASLERPQVAWRTTVDYRDVYRVLLAAATVAAIACVAFL